MQAPRLCPTADQVLRHRLQKPVSVPTVTPTGKMANVVASLGPQQARCDQTFVPQLILNQLTCEVRAEACILGWGCPWVAVGMQLVKMSVSREQVQSEGGSYGQCPANHCQGTGAAGMLGVRRCRPTQFWRAVVMAAITCGSRGDLKDPCHSPQDAWLGVLGAPTRRPVCYRFSWGDCASSRARPKQVSVQGCLHHT